MRHISLTQVIGGGRESRFSADGKRISRAQYERICTNAERLECFHTRAIPLPGGKTRRWNYSLAYIRESLV